MEWACRFSGIALLILLTVSTPAAAKPQSNGVPASVAMLVDSQAVTQQCLAGKAIREQHDRLRLSFQKDIESARLTLKKAEEELLAQQSQMDQAEWQAKARDFERRVTEFNQRVQQSNTAVERAYGQAMAVLWKNFSTVAAAVAAEKGANLVIPIQQVIYHDPNMDMTEAVIERMNKDYPVIIVPKPDTNLMTPLAGKK